MLTTAWLQHWYDTTSLSLFRYKDAFKADKITAFIFKRIDDSMLKDLGVVLESAPVLPASGASTPVWPVSSSF